MRARGRAIPTFAKLEARVQFPKEADPQSKQQRKLTRQVKVASGGFSGLTGSSLILSTHTLYLSFGHQTFTEGPLINHQVRRIQR